MAPLKSSSLTRGVIKLKVSIESMGSSGSVIQGKVLSGQIHRPILMGKSPVNDAMVHFTKTGLMTGYSKTHYLSS